MDELSIIKALECCPLDDIGGCRKVDALNLINRQKAEIERLQSDNKILSKQLDNLCKELDAEKLKNF